jgi:hypothetical protein
VLPSTAAASSVVDISSKRVLRSALPLPLVLLPPLAWLSAGVLVLRGCLPAAAQFLRQLLQSAAAQLLWQQLQQQCLSRRVLLPPLLWLLLLASSSKSLRNGSKSGRLNDAATSGYRPGKMQGPGPNSSSR